VLSSESYEESSPEQDDLSPSPPSLDQITESLGVLHIDGVKR
jgi:hypothetical protein